MQFCHKENLAYGNNNAVCVCAFEPIEGILLYFEEMSCYYRSPYLRIFEILHQQYQK
jgi:hypothetical protein